MKQTFSKFKIIGELQEINFALEDKKYDVKDENGNKIEVKGQVYTKKQGNFGSPNLLVKANGGNIGLDYFQVGNKKYDRKKKAVVDNPQFKAIKTITETYITAVGAQEGQTPTRVEVQASASRSEYAKEGVIKSFPKLNCFACSSTSIQDDSCEGVIEGFVQKFEEEKKLVDGELTDTGRYILTIGTINYLGDLIPQEAIVEEDLIDDFEEMYENGDSGSFSVEAQVTHIGGAKKQQGLGRSAKVSSGFDVVEYILIGATTPYEEEHKNYIDPTDMKTAVKERAVTLKALIQNEGNTQSKATNQLPPKAKGKRLGKSTSFEDIEDTGSKASDDSDDEDEVVENPFA